MTRSPRSASTTSSRIRTFFGNLLRRLLVRLEEPQADKKPPQQVPVPVMKVPIQVVDLSRRRPSKEADALEKELQDLIHSLELDGCCVPGCEECEQEDKMVN